MGHRRRFQSAADLALAGVAEGAGVAEVVEEMADDADAAVLLDAVEGEADAAGVVGIAELDHC